MKGLQTKHRFGLHVLIAVSVAMGACTSAEEILKDGVELEQAGSYEEAAWKYIGALQKEGDLIEARERLVWVADTVIAGYLDDANVAEATGGLVQAAEAYMEIDRLWSAAADVGVRLGLPADYGERRRRLLDQAIAANEQSAYDARATGNLRGASDLLREAIERFDPEGPTLDRLLGLRFDVLLEWADVLANEGHFRDAVRRTDEALAIAESGGFDSSQAMEMRTAALEAGTVYVAAAPVRRSDRVRRNARGIFLDELNDRLELDYWSRPPEFIAFAHPALVRRRLRQLNLDDGTPSRRDGRILAQDLDADFAVIAEIDRFDVNEKDQRQRERRAKTRSGDEVTYVEIQGRVELEVRLSYLIVDAHGDVIRADDFVERRSADFKRAEYDGDYRDLRLSRDEREMFNGDDYEESRDRIDEEMAKRVAQRFGQIVIDRILSRVR